MTLQHDRGCMTAQVMSVLLAVLRNADEALSEFLVQQVTLCSAVWPFYCCYDHGLSTNIPGR
jgi:hypothetical protein